MQKQKLHQDTGKTGLTDFRPDRKSYSAPQIHESFFDDLGEENYILSNGNTITKLRYDAMWLPKKSQVMPKNYKGENFKKY